MNLQDEYYRDTKLHIEHYRDIRTVMLSITEIQIFIMNAKAMLGNTYYGSKTKT